MRKKSKKKSTFVKIAKMHQESLLKEIRRKIGDQSLNDEIANILNISYDAAHRRTSLKSKFSLEEAIELAKHYQISLDQFLGTKNQIIAQRTQPIKTAEDLLFYFENSMKLLQDFKEKNKSTIYYSAKDLPFFYTISDDVLSRFKFYVWMNLLNEDEFLTSFSDFKLEYHSPQNEALKELYHNQKVIEIWNNTTISSILLQVRYYFEIGMIKNIEAIKILEQLTNILEVLEEKIIENPNYEVYINDLVILNNSIFFTNSTSSKYFIPFNMFGYMMTNDQLTCRDTQTYFEHQIKNSKSLNSAGNRDRKLFFNSLKTQIDKISESFGN